MTRQIIRKEIPVTALAPTHQSDDKIPRHAASAQACPSHQASQPTDQYAVDAGARIVLCLGFVVFSLLTMMTLIDIVRGLLGR